MPLIQDMLMLVKAGLIQLLLELLFITQFKPDQLFNIQFLVELDTIKRLQLRLLTTNQLPELSQYQSKKKLRFQFKEWKLEK